LVFDHPSYIRDPTFFPKNNDFAISNPMGDISTERERERERKRARERKIERERERERGERERGRERGERKRERERERERKRSGWLPKVDCEFVREKSQQQQR
jgi:hypothetical protein